MTFQLASTQLSTVAAYNQAQTQAAESAIIARFGNLFNQITTASNSGVTSVTYSLLNTTGDQTALVALLVKYGYAASIANNVLTVDWSVPKTATVPTNAITGFNLTNFNGVVATFLSVEIKPTGGTAPYTFTYIGALPDRCAFVSTANYAAVYGIPLAANEFYSVLTVTVTDSSWPATQTFSQDISYTIAPLNTVTDARNVISGTNISSFTGTTGVPLSVNISPTGGVGPFSYIINGTLPLGLASTVSNSVLNISGVPQSPGVGISALTVIITGYDSVFTQNISYTITGSSYTPNAITGINRTSFSGVTGTLLSASFRPVGGVAPFTFTFTGSLPHNCSYTQTANSFTISGAPDTPVAILAGLTLTVTDSASHTFSQDIDYTIVQGPVINLTSGLGTSYISALSMMI